MKRLETHVYSLKGIHLIWQHSCDLLNRQIKATAKYTTLTVATTVYVKTFEGGKLSRFINNMHYVG